MSLLEARDLSARYPRTEQNALNHVSFSIEQGETWLVLGPSGSGKSTLGLCLAGLIPHSVPAMMQGQILIDGRDAAEMDVGARTAKIGMVFQDPEAQFCMLTVEDEVAFGLENLAIPYEEMVGRISEALTTVGLHERRHERVDRLSGGQKQRLALACALARRPAILFLDEPTANLDPASRREFFQLLRRLREEQPGLTIILIEHILDDLIDLVDRVLLLASDGTVFGEGTPGDVLDGRDDELDQMGIWLPQVTALGHKLRAAGLPVARLPLTVGEAASALKSLLVRHVVARPAATIGAAQKTRAQMAIQVDDLTFGYGGRVEVLRNVPLGVPDGALFAIVGPNGSGKTTLASHFADILRPPAGRVFLLGDDITGLTTGQITERVGYVFQNPEHQFVEQHVDDELAYSLRVRHRPAAEIEAVVEQLLHSFGLEAHRRRNPFALSQGQKRRLSVATMLAVGQRVLVLDEPTFGQDRDTARALMERLCALHREGVTIVVITHDMQLVADYMEQVAVLVDGRIRFVGSTQELFADQELLQAASLRALPLHDLAREMDVRYADGFLPMTIRDWFPFFGLEAGSLPSPSACDRERAS
ncbi:MAG: energy-coupling factor ABC transporter ATP-binding protein [Chloroflexi bacterium]|nr:energy-coupling factor ABC transporter ATP-binding protein [Chloroflexota bacterium]